MSSALHQAIAEVKLWPGAVTEVEGVTLFPAGQREQWLTDLFFVTTEFAGSAERARVDSSGQRPVIELVNGNLLGRGQLPIHLTFDRWSRDLGVATSQRLELDQRGNLELMEVASRTSLSGRDASYEWSVWYKRFLHPVGAFFLTLGCLPAGGTRRASVSVAVAALGYLVAVRVGDHLTTSLGAEIGASFGLCYAVIWAAVAWLRWRDL